MKVRNIILAAIFAAGLVSCEDAYKIGAKDEIIDENAVLTISDLRSAMNGAYIGIGGSTAIEWNSYFSDEVRKPITNRGSGVQVHTWSINTGNTEAASLYSSYYATINRANVVLEKIETLNLTSEADINEAAKYKAELQAIRANAHFDLLRYFGESYTDMNAKGIALVTKPIVFEQIGRSSVGEVVNFVNSELETAYNELTRLSATNADKTKITPVAVQAMRARVALYTKNYDNAITFAQEVVAAVPLTTTANYTSIWSDATDAEVVFKLKRVTSGQGTIGTIYEDTNGDVLFNVSYGLFGQLASNDVRYRTTVDLNNSDLDNLLVGKYLGTAANPFMSDIKVIRSAEMYLILAEAYALKSAPDYTQSLANINALRAARRLNTTALPNLNYSDVAGATDAILNERRIELAFEGHRFLDLRRFNKGVDRLANDVTGNAFAQSLPAGDYRFVLPIPQPAIFANDNLTQNPGY